MNKNEQNGRIGRHVEAMIEAPSLYPIELRYVVSVCSRELFYLDQTSSEPIDKELLLKMVDFYMHGEDPIIIEIEEFKVGPDPITGEVYLENYRCWRQER